MNSLDKEKRRIRIKRKHELNRKKRRDVERKKVYSARYRGKIPLDSEEKMILKAKLFKYI